MFWSKKDLLRNPLQTTFQAAMARAEHLVHSRPWHRYVWLGLIKVCLRARCGQLPPCTWLHGGGWTLNKIRVLLEARISEKSKWREEGVWWLNEACEECLNTGGCLYLDASLTWEAGVTCAEQWGRLLAGRGRWACSVPLQKLHRHKHGQSSSVRTPGNSRMRATQALGKTEILSVRNLLIHWNIAY